MTFPDNHTSQMLIHTSIEWHGTWNGEVQAQTHTSTHTQEDIWRLVALEEKSHQSQWGASGPAERGEGDGATGVKGP